MGEWGPGIERHTQGTDAATEISFLCIKLGWGIGHAEPGSRCKAPITIKIGSWAYGKARRSFPLRELGHTLLAACSLPPT